MSRNSSGSTRTDKAVDPTMSQNITVNCLRSAPAGGADCTTVDAVSPEVTGRCWSALFSFRRRPSDTPIFSRSPSVRSASTSMSTSFDRRSGTSCSSPAVVSHRCSSSTKAPEKLHTDPSIPRLQSISRRLARSGGGQRDTDARYYRGKDYAQYAHIL